MLQKFRKAWALLDGHKTTILIVTGTFYCAARWLNGHADLQECVKMLGPLYGVGVINSRIGRFLLTLSARGK